MTYSDGYALGSLYVKEHPGTFAVMSHIKHWMSQLDYLDRIKHSWSSGIRGYVDAMLDSLN